MSATDTSRDLVEKVRSTAQSQICFREIFGKQIERELSNHNWYANHTLLWLCLQEEISTTEKILVKAAGVLGDSDRFVQQAQRRGSIHNLADFLLECDILCYLDKSGYKDVKFVDESDHGTPDIIATMGGTTHLIEVKNMIYPLSVAEAFLDAVESRKQLRDDVSADFDLFLSRGWEDVTGNEVDRKKLIVWLHDQFDECERSGEIRVNEVPSGVDNRRGHDLRLRIEPSTGGFSCLYPSLSGRGMQLGVAEHSRVIIGSSKRLLEKARYAIDHQIIPYAAKIGLARNDYRAHVFVQWQNEFDEMNLLFHEEARQSLQSICSAVTQACSGTIELHYWNAVREIDSPDDSC